jgi:hemerythrin-like metal-binding protein
MITWDPSYTVNFNGIDEQHKILISIIQEVETAINSQEYNYKNLIELVNKLENYIKVHLTYEEALMAKFEYPDAEKHQSEHNELRYKIQSINFDYIVKSKEFYLETYTYLSDWLYDHIMGVDRKLGNYLAGRIPKG